MIPTGHHQIRGQPWSSVGVLMCPSTARIGSVTVSQSPVNSNLLGSNQRPNVVAGIDPVLTSDPENSYNAGCGCIQWLNPAAWSQAAPFTFGNAPRTDGRLRTPVRKNWDGLMPVPGDGRYEWLGFHGKDVLPSSFNPAEGFFATANEMNLPAGYPNEQNRIAFEWTDRSRIDRIKEILSVNAKVSLVDSMAIQRMPRFAARATSNMLKMNRCSQK